MGSPPLLGRTKLRAYFIARVTVMVMAPRYVRPIFPLYMQLFTYGPRITLQQPLEPLSRYVDIFFLLTKRREM